MQPWSAARPVIAGLLIVFGMVGGFATWSMAARISGAVVAAGEVEVERNRQIVQHLDGGIVAEVRVVEGDRVDAGDVLLSLDGKLLSAELAVIEGQVREAGAQKSRLEAERDGHAAPRFPDELEREAEADSAVRLILDQQLALLAARQEAEASMRTQLRRRQDQIAEQQNGLTSQMDATRTQLELIREELRNQTELLAKGLTQAARVLELQRQEADLVGRIGEVEAALAEAAGRATEKEIEISRLGTERREAALTDLRTLADRELELTGRRRALLEQMARLDIRAPVGGVVQELSVTTPRAVVRPAEPILYLIPQDRALIVTARIPTIGIDEVYVGQDVLLRLAALAGDGAPDIAGRLATLSADAVTDPQTLVSYYRAEIELLPDEVSRLEGRQIVPGMPVEVFIKTGERSPLSYFLKPLTDYFARAFRES